MNEREIAIKIDHVFMQGAGADKRRNAKLIAFDTIPTFQVRIVGILNIVLVIKHKKATEEIADQLKGIIIAIGNHFALQSIIRLQFFDGIAFVLPVFDNLLFRRTFRYVLSCFFLRQPTENLIVGNKL